MTAAEAAFERNRLDQTEELTPEYNVGVEKKAGERALSLLRHGKMPPEIQQAQHAVDTALRAGYFDDLDGRVWGEWMINAFRDRVVGLLAGMFGDVTCYVVSSGGRSHLVVAPVGDLKLLDPDMD